MWKIRPNFSHLYSPIRPHVRCLTDYIKREKFNDILHRCGKIDRIHTSCDILDRKHHMWIIRPNFSHLHLPKISNVKFRLNMSNIRNMIEYFTDVNNLTNFVKVITYSAEYITCEKSDRISHTYISPKMFPFIKNWFTGVQAIEILMCDKLVWVKNSKSAKRILHLCPNVKNSVEFITLAWGIRSVRNTVQHTTSCNRFWSSCTE